MTETFTLSNHALQEIDHWLAKYPDNQRRSAVLSALRIAQEENAGWLSNAAMVAVADYLKIPHIEAFEVATFYDMFELQPVGKHTIAVCTNVACMLRGSDQIVEHLRKRLGVSLGETTKDGLFTLREVECLAACKNAPMCQVDHKSYCENLTPEKIDHMLEELRTNGSVEEEDDRASSN